MATNFRNAQGFTVGYNWGNLPAEFRPALWAAMLHFADIVCGLIWEPREPEAEWTVLYTWGPLRSGKIAECYYYYATAIEGQGLAMDMSVNSGYAKIFRSGERSLFSIGVHELGHAFGLQHNPDPLSAMYPYYRPVSGLHPMDISKLRDWGWLTNTRRWLGRRSSRRGTRGL